MTLAPVWDYRYIHGAARRVWEIDEGEAVGPFRFVCCNAIPPNVILAGGQVFYIQPHKETSDEQGSREAVSEVQGKPLADAGQG